MADEVRSVAQAFAILRLLADSDPLTLSDIGRALGLGPSSCFNLLGTLLGQGAIVREAPGKRYRLADSWARSGVLRDGDASRLVERLRPLMTRFARDHDATVGLWQIASKDRLRLAAHAESDAVMRIHLVSGQRQPLGSGSAGRAIAAAQSLADADLTRRFAAVRWQKPISATDYIAQVRLAERTGVALDDGYTHIGICSLAAVVPHRAVEFCLSASFFAGVRSAAEVADLGAALVALSAVD
jgi:IclR family acetate operon transcriptional repressor